MIKRLARLARLAWASPCSLVGLAAAIVPLVAGGKATWSSGALEVTYRDRLCDCGPITTGLPFRGIVFGHVILAISGEDLQRIGPHERVHVAQYERWGPLFFAAYAASSLWQLARGRDPYLDNHFEVAARAQTRKS